MFSAYFGPKTPTPEPEPEVDLSDARLDPGEKAINARRAEALLNDPMLSQIFDDIANLYRKQWEDAPRGSFELQQMAHLSLAALKDVRARLLKYLNDGKIFAAQNNPNQRKA